MATEKYPQRNHNIPMRDDEVNAARQVLDPGSGGPVQAPVSGRGSKRDVRPGEWVDDRIIQIGGPASPSEGKARKLFGADGRALPTFESGKVYAVKLGKPCMFAGRMLSPSMSFEMTGDTCNDPVVGPCIAEAEYVGDLMVQPDAAPSE